MAGAVAALSTSLEGISPALAAPGEGSAIRPVRLTTEHLTDPLGIDATQPRFGWRLEAAGENRKQTAYRILVASKRELLREGQADVWDSGRVSSGEQTAQVYGGPALLARTRYFWTVRAWDETGSPGPYAGVAWFETALLEAGDWTARWIGTGRSIPDAVRVLDPRQTDDVRLTTGNTLGQSFVTHGPTVAVTVLLKLETDSAGFVMTLHRDGPGGAVVGSRRLSDVPGDRYRNIQGRLDFAAPIEAGTYYLELSEPVGHVCWPSAPYDDPRADPYSEGTGFTNGRPEQVDRWAYTITPPAPANPLLRREFSLGGAVESARLYLCGLGHGLAWNNGRPVNAGELTPAATDYDRRLLYTTYDVTSLLCKGSNALGIALGRGFFATRAPDTDGSNLQRWVGEPQALAQLEVRLADGRTVTVGTDGEWQQASGPTTYEGVFNGETYDARRAGELAGWSAPGFSGRGGWTAAKVVSSPGGRLEAFASEPIRPTSTVRPVSVKDLGDGIRLFDFGAVLTGNVRLTGRLAGGTRVRLQYAEKLGASGRIEVGVPSGNENPSIDGRFQRDEYLASGRGSESWQAAFTYKGFQYVEVSGAPRDVEVVAVQVSTDVTTTMELKLDSPVLQWIADAFKRTARNGLHGHPDLAGIAKAGWTGANHWMAQPALYQFGMQTVYAKWLEDLRLGQAPDGEVPLIAPMGATSGGFLFTPSSIGVYPWLVYRYCVTYGDRALAGRFFESVSKYIEWSVGKLASGVSEDQFGDWMPPNPPPEYPAGPEGGAIVGVAYVIQSVRHGVALAELLGKSAQAAAWRAKAAELVAGFNARFLDRAAGVYRTERVAAGYRQTSNAVPLAFGFVPADQVDRVLAGLAASISSKGGHLDTGNVGTATLPFALTDHGRPDLAHSVLGQTTYPSYGYLRSLGATTFWESWEADSRGHNDPTLSMPVSWLVERVVGVEATAPGWARFRVAPAAFGSLGWASVSLDTVRGPVAVGWRREGDVVALHVRVPVNAVADVLLPNGSRRELGSGRHVIVTRLG